MTMKCNGYLKIVISLNVDAICVGSPVNNDYFQKEVDKIIVD